MILFVTNQITLQEQKLESREFKQFTNKNRYQIWKKKKTQTVQWLLTNIYITCTSEFWLRLCEANRQSSGSTVRDNCFGDRRSDPAPWLKLPCEFFGPSSTDSLKLMTESLIFEMISLFSASKRSKWSIFSCNIESWPYNKKDKGSYLKL